MDYLECYRKAGKIASEVRKNSKTENHVGRSLFEICESVEYDIKRLGGTPAFPVNVSLNDIPLITLLSLMTQLRLKMVMW